MGYTSTDEQEPLDAAVRTLSQDESEKDGPQASAVLDTIGSEEMHWLTLWFAKPETEYKYVTDVAHQRKPVLMCVLVFDILCFTFRFLALSIGKGRAGLFERMSSILPQLLNMLVLHTTVAWLNRRSRESTTKHSRLILQEEVLLPVAMAAAVSFLLVTLGPGGEQDYVFACMFLICTSTFLKIRWLMGTLVLATPVLLVLAGFSLHLPEDAPVHLAVAWSVGGLMSYLADSNRRKMFANQMLAMAAAEKEIEEAKARTIAQRALADAQAQAAARALTVAKEKAANEAKSEFMSLMCHEVRTPLNGCLASAEMLLDTKLEDEQRELAKTIRVSGSILLSTVSNFLDFFKTEAGKALDVVCNEVDVQEMVNDVHCIIEAMIGRSSDVILMNPQLENVPQYLIGDADRLKGILLNLYTNAAKFTRRGAISLKVGVHGPDYRPQPADNEALHSAVEEIRQNPKQNVLEPGTVSGTTEPYLSSQLENAQNGKPPPNITAGNLSPRWRTKAAADAPGELVSNASENCPSSNNLSSGTNSTSSGTTVSTTQSEPVFGSSTPFGEIAPQGRNSEQQELDRRKAANSGSRKTAPLRFRDAVDSQAALEESSAVIDQADGWAQIVSSRTGFPSTSGQGVSSADDGKEQWVFFEVADTGVGIAPKGLKALFREFVQGTEDEMRQPRSRGGTGLGLSICSKQVGFLGGKVGVLSKPGAGSTFWLCVPLKLPDPAATEMGIELRRTASWGSRDAFTDGHLSHHAESSHRTEKRPSTAKAHAFRKFHPANKSIHSSIAGQKGRTARAGSSAAVTSPGLEPRRNSAPQLTYKTPVISAGSGVLNSKNLSRSKQVQRLTQPVPVPIPEIKPVPSSGTSAASFAAAKALLVETPRQENPPVNAVMAAFAKQGARHSNDMRMSLTAPDKPTQTNQTTKVIPKSKGYFWSARHGATIPTQRLSLEQVREAALEMDKIYAKKRMSLDQQSLQPAKRCSVSSDPGHPSVGNHRIAGKPARGVGWAALNPLEAPEGSEGSLDSETESSTRVSPDRSQEASEQLPGGLSDPAKLRTQGPATVLEDRELSDEGLSVSVPSQKPDSSVTGRKLVGRGQLRPSMEARWRKLDVSALQGRRILLAEDNLINQKVAHMMLTNLGMVVEVANNGQEALQLVTKAEGRAMQFHCVLMDMAMPIMGGVKATLEIRREGISVPIVAMTANASDRDRDECLGAGMDGFLSKPVLKDRLAEAIMLVTSGRARYNADSLVSLKTYNQL